MSYQLHAHSSAMDSPALQLVYIPNLNGLQILVFDHILDDEDNSDDDDTDAIEHEEGAEGAFEELESATPSTPSSPAAG